MTTTGTIGTTPGDATGEAMWAVGDFEACPAFRAGAEPGVCGCGWLEDDHGRDAARGLAAVTVLPRAVRAARVPDRRAS